MAEQMLPYHKPHEQLRTEAPKQKEHTDKYVTGESNVDMSFRAPILSKSSDYFKVGIDELTVNLSALSMLEYDSDEVIFRIVRRGFIYGELAGANGEGPYGYTNSTGDVGLPSELQMPDGPVGVHVQGRQALQHHVGDSHPLHTDRDRRGELHPHHGTYKPPRRPLEHIVPGGYRRRPTGLHSLRHRLKR